MKEGRISTGCHWKLLFQGGGIWTEIEMKRRSLSYKDRMGKDNNSVRCVVLRQHGTAWLGQYQDGSGESSEDRLHLILLGTYKENGFVME